MNLGTIHKQVEGGTCDDRDQSTILCVSPRVGFVHGPWNHISIINRQIVCGARSCSPPVMLASKT